VSRGWVALLAVVLFLLFSSLTLPAQSALAEKSSAGAGSPDTSLFYSGEQLYQLAGAYSEEGRQAYLYARWTFDVAFPLIYTFFLVTTVSWSLNKVLPHASNWRLLNLVPLAAMLLDFMENSMTSLVMARYPQTCLLGQFLAPVFTPLKWFGVGASFLILVAGILLLLIKQVQSKKLADS